MTEGRLAAIWIKSAHGEPMEERDEVVLVAGRGIEGNADQGGRRQVTLLDLTHWQRITDALGVPIDPSRRRANLLVEGIALPGSREGSLAVGECELAIRGETKPCRLMDEVEPGLQRALREEGAGGAFAEVTRGGTIRAGDPVRWLT